MKYGFIHPIVEEKDFILGAERHAPFKVVLESGDWRSGIPLGEVQRRGSFDSYGCTNWAWNNLIEIFGKKIFGLDWNWSERFLAVMSGQTTIGNDPSKVAEALRNYGTLKEERLPFTDAIQTWTQYFSPNPMTQELKSEASYFLDDFEFKHEYIFTYGTPLAEKQRLLQEALKRSPVGVSVYAWKQDESGIYVKQEGDRDTHWTCLVAAEPNVCWWIYDSYEQNGDYMKKLAWNYNFDIAKGFYLHKKTEEEKKEKRNIIWQILEVIKKILFLDIILLKKKEEVIVPDSAPLPPPAVKDDFNPPPNSSRVPDFARAIQKQEGWFPGSRSYRNKNPGNLKWSGLTKELGAIEKDKDFFCIFPGYVKGFTALCDFLKLACEDKLKPYRQARTLKRFCEVYANPPPNNGYATGIARDLNIELDTDIKTLL